MARFLVFARDHRGYELGDPLSVHPDGYVPRPGEQEMVDAGLIEVVDIDGYPAELDITEPWTALSQEPAPLLDGKRDQVARRVWSFDLSVVDARGRIPRASVERKYDGAQLPRVPGPPKGDQEAKRGHIGLGVKPARNATRVRVVPPRTRGTRAPILGSFPAPPPGGG